MLDRHSSTLKKKLLVSVARRIASLPSAERRIMLARILEPHSPTLEESF